MRERVVLAGLIAAGLFLAGCGGAGGGGASSQDQASCDLEDPPLFEDGTLTVATDRPAYPPWFKGDPQNYGGYEGEVASEVARRMDLPIKWVVEPFNKSYAPGAKDYDFDINQITITPERQRVVDFSDGYFDNAQGVLVLNDSPAADAESLSDLKDDRLGAQVGTTALDFVNTTIEPEEQAKVYDSTNDARSALEGGQIDAFVTDLVTTVYLRDIEIENSEVIGQYPENEQFGMLFEKGNPLVGCVNEVLGEMKKDGTLKDLRREHLQQYLEVPTLEK
ncbi:transporter substrate-binding domain-containing protein [Rubrobacter tropicus]|uniref:Transporter substrate-binding domain-containing protein n=1 Tax=Rubrobacter tropicus TaxID=2653851 RepID=A0A6G8Q5G5_9ACTN|nr:ABC transporter substrate-binding protein [Rubrobacter tropicus]QIN81683.1 transporter substrate-binding domain-containing protein [Rubrobacter tropicus]